MTTKEYSDLIFRIANSIKDESLQQDLMDVIAENKDCLDDQIISSIILTLLSNKSDNAKAIIIRGLCK